MGFVRHAFWLAMAAAIWWPAAATTAEEQSADEPAAETEAVFELEEFSVVKKKDSREGHEFRIGQRESCSHEPDKTVKTYPKLKSDKPWYGSVRFDRKAHEPNSGRLFHFVVDESKGTGKGYDRFYFDADRNLDLTNDPVLRPMKDPPQGAALPWSSKQTVPFDYLNVDFDYGPELGQRPLEMIPRFVINEYQDTEYASLAFVPTVGRRGWIKIGRREYRITLGHAYMVGGRFDNPWTGVHLIPLRSSQNREQWWGSDRLGAMRYVDGRWYSLASTPTGDRLFVKPYQGNLGVFEVGPGKRKIDKCSISGSLRSKDTAVPVGNLSKITYRPEEARQCTLPEGDYNFSIVSVKYGPLSINISNNYHADGKPRGGTDRPTIYGIKIRKNKPFVLDFSNKPEVMFASPAKNQTFKPGDEINMAAVLIDPKLDIMIRGLDRMGLPIEKKPKKEKKEAKKNAAKKTGSLLDAIVEAFTEKTPSTPAPAPRRSRSLDPTVTITDASGKVVSQGKMPFG
ncbi:MAG: hypothetical protein JW888_14290 [Pirellulales bacterium]|nr:hypothetical protein [Pirellulales bacterium]